jgi:hypothetical protein
LGYLAIWLFGYLAIQMISLVVVQASTDNDGGNMQRMHVSMQSNPTNTDLAHRKMNDFSLQDNNNLKVAGIVNPKTLKP